jgi:hypothetical protein
LRATPKHFSFDDSALAGADSPARAAARAPARARERVAVLLVIGRSVLTGDERDEIRLAPFSEIPLAD